MTSFSCLFSSLFLTATMSTTETKTTPEMVEKNDDITNNEIDDKKSSMINDAIERK